MNKTFSFEISLITLKIFKKTLMLNDLGHVFPSCLPTGKLGA